jgi:hypothetical protein
MRHRVALSAALAAALAAVALVALPATGARPKPRILLAAMSGQEETPQTDPLRYGAAYFEVVGNKICFSIAERQPGPTREPAIAGHIHRGLAGQDGDIVVPLFTGDVPGGKRCVKTTRSKAREIARFPGRFYVNVHTATFGDGAIRGQLER